MSEFLTECRKPVGQGGARVCAKAVEAGTPETSAEQAIRNGPTRNRISSHREHDDDYANVVARLTARWRVIVCLDGLQWILLRRDGERAGRARWTGFSCWRTRDALLSLCRAYCAQIEPGSLALLLTLPIVIGWGRP